MMQTCEEDREVVYGTSMADGLKFRPNIPVSTGWLGVVVCPIGSWSSNQIRS